MDSSTPGFPVHQLLELAETHVHPAGDAIQSSYLPLSPSPPAFNLSLPSFFPSIIISSGLKEKNILWPVGECQQYAMLFSVILFWKMYPELRCSPSNGMATCALPSTCSPGAPALLLWFHHSLVSPFIPSHNNKYFTHLLCVRHCSRCWGVSKEIIYKVSVFIEFDLVR